jgi:hypothetical protein
MVSKLAFLGAILAATAAADQVMVTSSCTNATCIGGIKPGVTLQDGVQALDVYTGATANTSVNQTGSVSIGISALLETSGSGPGTLFVNPIYTLDYQTAFPHLPEFNLIWNVGGLSGEFGGCIRIGFCSPPPNGAATIPITLGTTFTFSLDESMLPPNEGIPEQATVNIGQDIELWVLGPNGNTPVSLAATASPEPRESALLLLGIVMVAARWCAIQRHRTARNKSH